MKIETIQDVIAAYPPHTPAQAAEANRMANSKMKMEGYEDGKANRDAVASTDRHYMTGWLGGSFDANPGSEWVTVEDMIAFGYEFDN